VWNEIKDTVKDVAMRAIHMIGEWRDVNRMQHNSNNIVVASAELHDSGTVITGVQDVSHSTDLLRWQKPQFGWWKCNVNASLSQHSSHTSWAWCIRDANGSFLAEGTNRSTQKLIVAESEAMAILEAIREANFRG
jgi:hypothetical protein